MLMPNAALTPELPQNFRTAGIRIVTCSDGEIDLTTFEGRIVHTVRQEGRHAFLIDLSRKVLRGQVANAKQGNSNGGVTGYGLDRVLVDPSGTIVRRLTKGEQVRMSGHRVRHALMDDKDKLAAIKYMFDRFVNSDIGCRALAVELDAKGFPTPTGNGWRAPAVSGILQNPCYCGKVRWGARAAGSYHTTEGDEIVSSSKPVGRARRKPAAELDAEVGRLVKAVRSLDMPELVKELAERLKSSDPAVLREILRQTVSRITCRWERKETKTGKPRCVLSGGKVELRGHGLFSCLTGTGAHALP